MAAASFVLWVCVNAHPCSSPGSPVFVTVRDRISVGILNSDDQHDVRWFEIRPVLKRYDNWEHCGQPDPDKPCAVPISETASELNEFRGRHRIEWSDGNPLSPGTHRFAAGTATSLPQTETGSGRVVEIVVRSDDSYTGFLSELIGVPFVFWPRYLPEGHQTDRRLGADCAALLIYGRRRMGIPQPYVAPQALAFWLDHISQGSAGQPVRRGDVLHFGFQTAVVYEDRGRSGYLDDDDLIIHTYEGVAQIVEFRKLAYSSLPFKVMRWSEEPQKPSDHQ